MIIRLLISLFFLVIAVFLLVHISRLRNTSLVTKLFLLASLIIGGGFVLFMIISLAFFGFNF